MFIKNLDTFILLDHKFLKYMLYKRFDLDVVSQLTCTCDKPERDTDVVSTNYL